MKLFIPPLGTKLKLLEDWKFQLHYEHRNDTLLKAQGFVAENEDSWRHYWSVGKKEVTTSLPKGTVLIIDRIYIRKGAKDFDSVSFFIGEKPKGVGLKGKIRFWVKLHDANTIQCEVIS